MNLEKDQSRTRDSRKGSPRNGSPRKGSQARLHLSEARLDPLRRNSPLSRKLRSRYRAWVLSCLGAIAPRHYRASTSCLGAIVPRCYCAPLPPSYYGNFAWVEERGNEGGRGGPIRGQEGGNKRGTRGGKEGPPTPLPSLSLFREFPPLHREPKEFI